MSTDSISLLRRKQKHSKITWINDLIRRRKMVPHETSHIDQQLLLFPLPPPPPLQCHSSVVHLQHPQLVLQSPVCLPSMRVESQWHIRIQLQSLATLQRLEALSSEDSSLSRSLTRKRRSRRRIYPIPLISNTRHMLDGIKTRDSRTMPIPILWMRPLGLYSRQRVRIRLR